MDTRLYVSPIDGRLKAPSGVRDCCKCDRPRPKAVLRKVPAGWECRDRADCDRARGRNPECGRDLEECDVEGPHGHDADGRPVRRVRRHRSGGGERR